MAALRFLGRVIRPWRVTPRPFSTLIEKDAIKELLIKATYLQLKGDVVEAEAVARRAMGAIEQRGAAGGFGAEVGELAAMDLDCTTFLGKLLQQQGKMAAAEGHFRRALAAREAVGGGGDLEVEALATRGQLAYVLEQQGKERGDTAKLAERLAEELIDEALDGGSYDNISAIVCFLPGMAAGKGKPERK